MTTPTEDWLQYYLTAAYPCAYLPQRQARSQVAAPSHLLDNPQYSALIRRGFRRSGVFVYRPQCDDCQACIPVRVDVNAFQPNRSQRRAWRQHADLQATELTPQFDAAHFDLYRRYLNARHAGDGMDQDEREQYTQFLLHSPVDTRLIEFRSPDGALRMVSVIDCLSDGLSSVYTFFDPELAHSSLGTWGVLWQIATCRALGLPWLYLGYWIEATRKMRYKVQFQPLEGRIGGQWQALPKADS